MWRVLRILVLLVSMTMLIGCLRSVGRIEPVVQESYEPGLFRHRLTASTNCAEVGEVVVFTAELTNESHAPFTIVEQPPLDIIIRPFWFGNDAPPITRWSATDQYPHDINPVLAPGGKRVYTWHWIADAAYTQVNIRNNGTTVQMPLTIERTKGGGRFSVPLPDVVVGVKANPMLGNGGVSCKDLR